MLSWSIQSKYLHRQGLLAVWRESLLAQKVLRGETKGYRHHPQLTRFHLPPKPLAAVVSYLVAVAEEAETRGTLSTVPGSGPGAPGRGCP